MQTAALGGRSTLLHFSDAADASIEITRAHPGSLPQFITGRSTLLSNLFRDEVALRTARLAAERITAKNLELRTTRGLEPVHLAVGLALVAHRRTRLRGPRAAAPARDPPASRGLRAQAARRVHRQSRARPRTAHALRHRGRRPGARGARPRRRRVQAAAGHRPPAGAAPRASRRSPSSRGCWCRASPTSASAMARDAADLDHPILNALAGHPDDREALTAVRDVVPPVEPRRARARRRHAAARRRRGAGGGPRPHHRRPVARRPHAAGHRRHADRHQRARRAGPRRQARARRERAPLDARRRPPSPRGHRPAGTRGLAAPPAARPHPRDRPQREGRAAEDRRHRRRARATARRAARLPRRRDRAAIPRSASRSSRSCASSRDSPGRSIRPRRAPASISRPSSGSPRRGSEAAAKLAAAARLGEFRFGPGDSPWYGVTFATTEQARAAHGLAARLHRQDVPSLLERGYELIGQTRMRPFQTIAELGVYLQAAAGHPRLARPVQPHGVRAAARRADPGARSAARCAVAERREPPAPAPALARVHAARACTCPTCTRPSCASSSSAPSGSATSTRASTPEVPLGLADVHVAWQRVEADLAQLDGILRPQRSRPPLDAARRAARAHARRRSRRSPRSSTTSSSARRCAPSSPPSASSRCSPSSRSGTFPRSRVAGELEFAWWQSALEHLLRTDRALLGANTAVVDRLERDFRLVDEAHAGASGPLLASQLATQWRIGIVDEPAEAAALKRALKRGR